MTLRTRLLAALLALLAAVCVVVGVVSVLALDSFLMDRLDGQLATAATRLAGPDPDHDHSGDQSHQKCERLAHLGLLRVDASASTMTHPGNRGHRR